MDRELISTFWNLSDELVSVEEQINSALFAFNEGDQNKIASLIKTRDLLLDKIDAVKFLMSSMTADEFVSRKNSD
jgi:hypothetical protein